MRFSDGHEADFLARDILAEAALAPGDARLPAVAAVGWNADEPAARGVGRAARRDAVGGWLTDFLRASASSSSPACRPQPRTMLQVAAAFGFTRDTNFGALFDVRSVPAGERSCLHVVAAGSPHGQPLPLAGAGRAAAALPHQRDHRGPVHAGGWFCRRRGSARAATRKAFKLLARTPVRFRYRDAGTELVASAAPIELDGTGGVQAINFSPRLDFVPLRPPQELAALLSRAARVRSPAALAGIRDPLPAQRRAT